MKGRHDPANNLTAWNIDIYADLRVPPRQEPTFWGFTCYEHVPPLSEHDFYSIHDLLARVESHIGAHRGL